MTKKNQLLAIGCCFCLILSLLSGCGGASSAQESASSASEPEVSEDASAVTVEEEPEAEPEQEEVSTLEEASALEDEEPAEEEAELLYGVYRTYTEAEALPLTEEAVTLTAWDYVVPPMMTAINDYGVDGLVYATIQEWSGITLSFTTANLLTATEQMALMVNANELPDIIFDFGMFYSGSMEDLVNSDIIIDFADYEDLMPNYFDILNNNIGIYRDATYGNGVVPLAVNIQNVVLSGGGPVVRQDWLDALGLDTPHTIDELHTVLLAFQSDIGSEHPLWVNSLGNNSAIATAFDISAGSTTTLAGWMYKDGEVQFCVTMDNYRDYIDMLSTWYAEGLIDPDFMASTNSSTAEVSQLTGNGFGVWSTPANAMTDLSAYEPEADVQAVPLFVLEEGNETHFDEAGTSQIGKGGAAIACTNPEIELSVQLIDYFYSEDGIILENYGVEGVSYEIVDGEPQFTDLLLNNPDGLAFAQALIKYTSSTPCSITINERNFHGYTEAQVYAYSVWGATGELYMTPGETWTVEDENEYNSLIADMETYCNTEITAFITGAKAMSEWDSFIETLTASFDIARMQELEQNAVDAYLAK